MTRPVLLIVVLVMVALLAACAPQPSDAPPAETAPVAVPADQVPENVKAELKNAVMMLGGSLKARLSEELGAHGPLAAINVCAKEAPKMTAEASTAGVSVRRVSLKIRNPMSQPSEYEREQLEHFAQLVAEGKVLEGQFKTRLEGDETAVYFFKPLLIEKACVNCHGPVDSLDEELAARLAELYPADQATGYEEGDLRGMFSARTTLPNTL